MSDITKILKEASKDVLTDDSLKQIEEAFNNHVNDRVKDRVQVEVDAALEKQDKDYSLKLEKLIKSIDEDHSRKLTKLVESLDLDRAKKLKKVVNLYEKELKVESKKLKDMIGESMSNYFDLYLEESIPTKTIAEAVRNKKAYSVLKEIRNTLGIDLAFSNSLVRDGIIDGKNHINKYSKDRKNLYNENKELKGELDNIKKTLFLNEKTSELSRDKSEYLKNVFNDKSLKFVKENFDYASNIFEKKDHSKRSALKGEAINSSFFKSNVDEELITESQNENEGEKNKNLTPLMKQYLEGLGEY